MGAEKTRESEVASIWTTVGPSASAGAACSFEKRSNKPSFTRAIVSRLSDDSSGERTSAPSRRDAAGRGFTRVKGRRLRGRPDWALLASLPEGPETGVEEIRR